MNQMDAVAEERFAVVAGSMIGPLEQDGDRAADSILHLGVERLAVSSGHPEVCGLEKGFRSIC